MPSPASPTLPAMHWDLFCRVIDNFGDIGVSWRLASDLARRGQQVRLWVDDPSALAWMAPCPVAGVQVLHWTDDTPLPAPGDVVVETFGCDPPAAFVARMAARATPPVWLNLEYLSAEAYVARSHRLASPQFSGPGAGLTKWFFYPGFSTDTGGLLREPGLLAALDALDGPAFLRELGVQPVPGERCVSLFCYDGAQVPALAARLADAPTLLLGTPGAASAALAAAPLPPQVRHLALPWLSQADYDRLLRACTLNFVRGEDSFVRAQWAGRPFIWQIYPQHDGVHAGKLDAFLDRHLAGADDTLASAVRGWMRAWNGLTPALPDTPLPAAEWARHSLAWRQTLAAQEDLVSQLSAFVLEQR